MNSRHKKTLQALFKEPVQSNIEWSDVEALFRQLGHVAEGAGSRVRVEVNGVRAVFHRPHPQKETDKGAVTSVRKFLENAGVKPEGA
jgi:hypothetical protein